MPRQRGILNTHTQQEIQMYTHLFKTANGYQVVVSTTTQPVGTTTLHTTKKEAKQYATTLNATAWNY